jgi:hypothetical protein
MTSGQDGAKLLPISPHWLESAVRLKSQKQKEPKRCSGIGMRSIKELSHRIKATITTEVVLAYPDYSKVFKIYTDASSKQLGVVITQDNRPIAFFGRKFSIAQRKYSVTKIEPLAIVKTLQVGGPVHNLSIFQISPIPMLGVLTCSTSSLYDILIFSRKIIDHNPPVGRDKRDNQVLGGGMVHT